MSTLLEIEAAADTLPAHQQLALLRHLESRLRGRLVMENGIPVLVAPPGAPEMTPEFIKELLADFP